jgi:GNAT superfamily N-acetyltransferase
MTTVAPLALDMRPNEPRAIQTITSAFTADPVSRWCWPDLSHYLEAMPAFTTAFAGRAFGLGTAFCADNYRAVALRLPPSSAIDEAGVDAVLRDSIEPSRRADVYQMLEDMARYHPSEPHWYLPLMGVDPAAQGQGFGRALLEHGLGQCDRDGTVAYLEATSP